MGNEIKFIVLGDVKDLENKLAGTKKAFDNVAKISAVAFTAMTASAYGFIEAAREQESAINALNQALANQGNYSAAVSQDLQKYASALQEVSLFGDETIIKAESLIASFGFEGQTLKDLTKATLDLAQAKGMDLSSAADLVGKSVGGTTNALARYGIQIDGVAGSSERAQSAVAGLNRLYGGQAEAATKGLGATVVLKNAMSDLSEEIGKALTPAVLEVTRNIKSFVDYAKNNPEITRMAADFLVLGIKISGAALAFSILGKAAVQAGVGLAALNVQLAFLNSVQLAGLTTSVGVLIKNVGLLYPGIMIAAAGWAGWEIGKLINQIPIVDEFLDRVLGEVPTENHAMRNGVAMTTQEEIAFLAEQQAQRQIEQLNLVNQTKKTLQEEELANYQAYQDKIETLSDANIASLQMSLQQETDLTRSFEQQKSTIVNNEMKARSALREADKQGQLGMIGFAQTMTQALGKESKAAFYILQALRVAEILVNGFAADENIAAVWAWNPPVESALIANNHRLMAMSIAGVVATTIASSFAVGTPKIPQDMVANVHKNEMIVPATFAESIRSGELSLSGSGGGGVTVDLSGSTFNGVTESFVRDIFTRASEAINNRTLSPLPAA